MLIQSSSPSPIETAVSSVSNHGQQEFIRVWISGDRAWQELPEGNKHPHEGCVKAIPVTECKNEDDNSCSPNLLSCSRLSAVTTTSESSTPISVYKRRKIQKNPAGAEFPASNSSNTKPIDYCLSASSCETLSAAAKRDMVSHVHANKVVLTTPHVHPMECCKLSLASKLVSVVGCSLGDEPATEQDPKGDMRKGLLCGINDSCSSSKSSLDLGSSSSKPEMDDNGECSSSGALAVDGLTEYISEKDLCISFLRSHGVLGGMKPPKACASAGPISIGNDSCLRSCKVCLQYETTLKMLICDQCEEAFHVSCCNPGIKKIPVDEWFCHSCFRKKLKNLETGSSKSLNVISDKGRRKTVTPKDELGPIECMLRDAETYTTKVRVGKEFQAEVLGWSGPIAHEINYIGEALEVSPSECVSYQGCNSNKPSRLGSIGNWLQCQEVIYGVGEEVDGTICGKWRRAPLFEVQSDNWECFCSVSWDPTHADCSVPQELDTDQVLKQLKYVEMLRPRLAAKRSKLGVSKGSDSQEPRQDRRNT